MFLRPFVELDIYGSNDSITIVGDTKTGLAPKHIRFLERDGEDTGS